MWCIQNMLYMNREQVPDIHFGGYKAFLCVWVSVDDIRILHSTFLADTVITLQNRPEDGVFKQYFNNVTYLVTLLVIDGQSLLANDKKQFLEWNNEPNWSGKATDHPFCAVKIEKQYQLQLQKIKTDIKDKGLSILLFTDLSLSGFDIKIFKWYDFLHHYRSYFAFKYVIPALIISLTVWWLSCLIE